MRQLPLLSILMCFCLLTGCGEPQADLLTPLTHKSGELVFDYPKNWAIAEDSLTPELHNLFIETPGDALVILQSFPSGGTPTLTTFSHEFSNSVVIETFIGEFSTSTFSNIIDKDGCNIIEEDFNINLLGESIPHKRIYGTKEVGNRKIFLILQVAAEDYSKVEAGFQLIRDSLTNIPSLNALD